MIPLDVGPVLRAGEISRCARNDRFQTAVIPNEERDFATLNRYPLSGQFDSPVLRL
jgi:hypothetical protein